MSSPQDIESRKGRTRLKPNKHHAPHWLKIRHRVALGYRKPESGGAGTWLVRWREGAGYKMQNLRARDGTFAVADDIEAADGGAVLTFEEAKEEALRLAKTAGLGGGGRHPLVTVEQALAAYDENLQRRNGDIRNVGRVRVYLPAKLGKLLVARLTERDFEGWSAALIEAGMKPGSLNRTNKPLKAALNFAARQDNRVERRPWNAALAAVRDDAEPRNVVLEPEEIVGIVRAAYQHSAEFGLFVEIAAQTGCRPSQIARIQVRNLEMNRAAPRILVPASFKGRGDKARKAFPVSITLSLARRLAAQAKGRVPKALLLAMPDGRSWEHRHADFFRAAVLRFDEKLAKDGKDGAKVTIYALRHSHITRQLQKRVPTRIVAACHDTSIFMIEKHYSATIVDHSEELVRETLVDFDSVALPALVA